MMKPITKPEVNYNHPDEVLAQTLAAQHGFQMNAAGEIYDSHGIYVAKNLTELAAAARTLEWFSPEGAVSTGVFWSNVPNDAEDVTLRLGKAIRNIRN